MNDNQAAAVKASAGYWIVAVLGTVWNAFGGYDYTMTRMRNLEYLGQMGNPQDMLAWIDGMPAIAQVLWPLGVWGSVAGSLLMLLRSRHAVTAFLASLVGAVGSFAVQMGSPTPASLDTTANKLIPLVIVGIVAALWWYCRRSAARGILR